MRWTAFVVSLGLVGGCGDSNAVDPAAEDLAGSVCDLAFRCCSRGEVSYLLGPYVFADDCAERLVTTAGIVPGISLDLSAFINEPGLQEEIVLPNLTVLDRAVRAGRTKVNGDRVAECVDFIRGLTCAELIDEPEEEGCVAPTPLIDSKCELSDLFEGTGEHGDECASPGLPIECKPGMICAPIDSLGLEGTCVELGDEGDPCFTNFECRRLRETDEAGMEKNVQLYCSQLDGTCRRPSLAGETCLYADRDNPGPAGALLIRCDVGLSCDALSDTCVQVCERGAACTNDAQCDKTDMLSCILGRCDLLREEGLPCGIEQPGNLDNDCVAGLRCEPNPIEPTIRICVPKIANNQPCAPFTGSPDCASGWCNPETGVCEPQKPPGAICENADDAQCANGYCDDTFVACSTNLECVGSGTCNVPFGRCEFYCIAFLADGSPCDSASECQSGACVGLSRGAGICRTLPLPEGAECDGSSQCDSEFCSNESPPVCATLPLADGRGCATEGECASTICYENMCNPGLPAGQLCNDISLPPCHADLYCTDELDPPKCVPRLDAGEVCEGNFQCRGSCVSAYGRMICDGTPPIGKALCDGEANEIQ